MSAKDPTLTSLAMLDDPEQFELFAGGLVPIFKPHKRYDNDGNFLYEVNESRLSAIVNESVRVLKEDGVPIKIQIGHTPRTKVDKLGKAIPIPPAIGYAKDAVLGSWGPKGKPGMLANCYFKKGVLADIHDKYPYRSVEFWPGSNRISAIALTENDPELDLGLVNFAKSEADQCFFYSLGASMPEQTTKTNLLAGDGNIDEKEAEHFVRYMKHCYPGIHKEHSEKYSAGSGTPGPGSPGCTNVTPPTFGEKPKKKAEHMEANTDELVMYQKQVEELKASQAKDREELAAKEKRLADLEKKDRMYTYERVLRDLEREDGLIFKMDDELADVADLSAEQFTKHAKRMKENYQRRVPARNGFIPTERAKSDKPVTREMNQAAISMATKEGIEYDAALAKVRG